MKIGITGLSNSGKSTVFNSLTGFGVETAPYTSTGGTPNMGVVKVPDARLERLAEILGPRKSTESTVRFLDYLGLTRGDMKQNRSVFEFIKDSDALLHVVRAFEEDSVIHPLGGVEPVRDVAAVETELLFGDLELVERRLQGLRKAAGKGEKVNRAEFPALEKCLAALEGETPLRDVDFAREELDTLSHLQFMSIKPETVLLNIGEEDLGGQKAAGMEREVAEFYSGRPSVRVLSMSGKIEMEIAELPQEEAAAFLGDLGLEEPALNRLIRASYESVGLISFFTVVGEELRAWAVKRGTDALGAAGKVHSDIQRGFIRAEVIHYEEFIGLKNFAVAREKGLMRLEGKQYEVRDGDIITFRFNV
jgi:GTP-binding protein YchF